MNYQIKGRFRIPEENKENFINAIENLERIEKTIKKFKSKIIYRAAPPCPTPYEQFNIDNPSGLKTSET